MVMKVHFFQDNTFFRTARGTNPFFDPIIQVCEENEIEWKVWTTVPTPKCGYPPEKVGYFGRFAMGSVWLWRVAHLVWPMATWRYSWLYGRLMRPFVRKRFGADLFITVAGNLCEQLVGIAPEVRNIDVQHGVIYSKHRGYFDDTGRLREVYQTLRQREFWLYGQGYADCFFKHPANCADLSGRVKILGDVVGHPALPLQDGRNVLAFSVQLTGDFTAEVSAEMVRRMRRFFEEAYAKYGSRLRYLLKQHPRFNHCDIEPLKALPYLEFTDAPWPELYPQMLVHVTFSSTVCFDCASCGIPTRFEPYPENNILDSRYYQDDYSYPYLDWSLEHILEEQTRDPDTLHRTIRAWYETCYTPFSKENCLKLLKGEV